MPVEDGITFEEVDQAALQAEADKAAETTVDAETDNSKDAGTEDGAGEKKVDLDAIFKDEETAPKSDLFEQLGITADNIGDITKKAQAFEVFSQLLETNPDKLLDRIGETSPQQLTRLMDVVAKRYEQAGLESFDTPDTDGKNDGKGDPRVDILINVVNDLKKQLGIRDLQDQEQTQRTQLQEVRKSYEGRRDSMLAKVPGLSEKDTKAVRALVNQEIANDQQAQQAIAKGDFRLLAKHVKGVVQDWMGDKLGAVQAEAEKRDAVKKAGVKQVGAAPNASAGEETPDDWNNSSVGLADSLIRMMKGKK